MNKLIMFPTIVMLVLTLIAAPSFWEVEESEFYVSRTVTEGQLEAIVDVVHDCQDDIATWWVDWTDYEDWTTTYYEQYRDDIYDELNTQFAPGINDTIRSIHLRMAGILSNWVLYYEINEAGAYMTDSWVEYEIRISRYLRSSVEYEGDMSIYREVTDAQFTAIYDVVIDVQYEYAGDSDIAWWQNGEASCVWAIYSVLQQQFGYEEEEYIDDAYSNTQHHNMAKALADMIRDAGDPAGAGAEVEEADVYAVIVVDPEQTEFNDIFSKVGYHLESSLVFIGIILVAAAVSLIGIRVSFATFSASLSDTTVHFITMFVTYGALWVILSTLARPMIEDTANIGIPIWVMLTALYTFGVLGSVGGSGE